MHIFIVYLLCADLLLCIGFTAGQMLYKKDLDKVILDINKRSGLNDGALNLSSVRDERLSLSLLDPVTGPEN